MKLDQAVKKCEELTLRFDNATLAMEQIFKDLHLSKETKGDIDQTFKSLKGPKTQKFAASAIISDVDAYLNKIEDPNTFRVAAQLAKIGDKTKIFFPGGAIISKEELSYLNEKGIEPEQAPGNLFYVLAEQQLSKEGKLSFNYDLENGFMPVLSKNLKRELGEELGQKAVNTTAITDFFTDQRSTILSSISLPNKSIQSEIAEKLKEQGVKEVDGRLEGIYTRVDERVAMASGNSELLSKISIESEEARGIKSMPLGQLADIAERTSVDQESFKNYIIKYNNIDGTDGLRNPSTTWAASLFTEWLGATIANQDDYKWLPGDRE